MQTPPPQFCSHFHDCWIEWKINFPILAIFILLVMVDCIYNLPKNYPTKKKSCSKVAKFIGKKDADCSGKDFLVLELRNFSFLRYGRFCIGLILMYVTSCIFANLIHTLTSETRVFNPKVFDGGCGGRCPRTKFYFWTKWINSWTKICQNCKSVHIYMKDSECDETIGKSIFAIFNLLDMVIFVLKIYQFFY